MNDANRYAQRPFALLAHYIKRRPIAHAAILFADILLPAIPLGVGLEFAKGEGPVLKNPVRTMDDVKNLRPVNPESDLGYVLEALRILRGTLTGVPLIGFCGAPFTVASYLIEGGSSRESEQSKARWARKVLAGSMTGLCKVSYWARVR